MNPQEQELINILKSLPSEDRASVLSYARFLAHQRATATQAVRAVEPAAVEQPVDIPRPAQETVVGALKRMTASYPMLDKAQLLNQTSPLVAQHVMQGRSLVEVINEIEAVFKEAYTQYCRKRGV